MSGVDGGQDEGDAVDPLGVGPVHPGQAGKVGGGLDEFGTGPGQLQEQAEVVKVVAQADQAQPGVLPHGNAADAHDPLHLVKEAFGLDAVTDRTHLGLGVQGAAVDGQTRDESGVVLEQAGAHTEGPGELPSRLEPFPERGGIACGLGEREGLQPVDTHVPDLAKFPFDLLQEGAGCPVLQDGLASASGQDVGALVVPARAEACGPIGRAHV